MGSNAQVVIMKNSMYTKYMAHTPTVKGFFDIHTNTISYVVADPETKDCVVIDSVLDYEPNGASLSYESADALIAYIQEHEYRVVWILETHVHADHLSAAPYIQEKLGGKLGIGRRIVEVQEVFGKVFNAGTSYKVDGSQFDALWDDGDTFMVGNIPALVLHVPGHTPADVAYVIGDAVFVGDTLFMPDYGTARCDFPGGNAETLYASVQRLFTLPDEMRMFLCHDYLPEGRSKYVWETTVGEQRKQNIHIHDGVAQEIFTQMRKDRDATLGMPKLIIPSIQVNIGGGVLPKDEETKSVCFKIPVNSIFAKRYKYLVG